MQSTKVLRMQPFLMQSFKAQPSKMQPFNMLRAQAPAFRAQQTRGIRIQPTKAMKAPVPKEEHSAHTISQRLRTLKKMPPELIPLFVVVIFAVGAATFSMTRKLTSDKTLRLWPEKKRKVAHEAEHH